MAAVWMRAKNELRARRRAWLAIGVMVGIGGGVVMAAAAGARRSETAVPRFLAYAQATDAEVEADPGTFRAIAHLPQVESSSAGAFMLVGQAGASTVENRFTLSVIGLTDPMLHPRFIVPKGRLFDLNDPGQAMINETALRSGAFKIGQRIDLQGFTFDQLEDILRGSNAKPKGPSFSVTIVGVLRGATDLTTTTPPPGVIYTGNNVVVLTPELYRSIGAKTANFPGLSVRLKRGQADMPAFTKAVADLTKGEAVVHRGSDEIQAGLEAQRATHTEALALWAFTALAGVAVLLVIGQSISRQIFMGSVDSRTLQALGMSRGQLSLAALIQVLAAAIVGSLVAVSTAILLSPLAPIGLARLAEVDIGFHLDLPVVLIGAAACLVLLVARAAIPAWLASRDVAEGSARHPSRAADAFARAGMPASSVAGVQMALDPGRGRHAVPVRTAIAGSVVATAVLVTALAFGASLTRLAGSPRLQGWAWDFAVGNPHSDDVSVRAIPLLRRNPNVEAFSADTYGPVVIDGRKEIVALGLDTVVGDVAPPMLEGRAPERIDELALGTKALRALNKRVGDSVQVSSQDGQGPTHSMRIVGRTLINPAIVNGELTLGDGVLMRLDAFRRFVPPAQSDAGAVNVFLVKLAPGVDRDAAKASLQRDFPGTVLTPYAPAEVENLRRIDSLPFVLAGLIGILAAATIAHALVTSVRRRRHDLAILKTLGFVRSQVRATVAWQASSLSAIAAAIGLAIGVVGGRWLWIFYAERFGVRPEPSIPLIVLIVMMPGALLLANVIAAVPSRAAARTQPALVLRTE